ncbi:hypothetical protein CEQ90_11270 [Lewinellaceae bacterium SD302]|nr:hypothetical protein CEQ90_11270 [Lewinellaceae bacterium SD302]
MIKNYTMPIQKILTLLFISLLFSACQGQSSSDIDATDTATLKSKSAIYQRVDNATFKEKMQEEHVVILDVRTKGETDRGVIGDATLIDFRSNDFQSRLAELPRDKTYLLYCQSGGRSARAAKLMQEMGFAEIYELERGYGNWE